jgi:hypothetical protein
MSPGRDDFEVFLRRALHAAVDPVEPADDGLDRIRARLTGLRPLLLTWPAAVCARVGRWALGGLSTVLTWLRPVRGTAPRRPRAVLPGMPGRRWAHAHTAISAALAMAAVIAAVAISTATPLLHQALSRTAAVIHHLAGGGSAGHGGANLNGRGGALSPGATGEAGTAHGTAGHRPTAPARCPALTPVLASPLASPATNPAVCASPALTPSPSATPTPSPSATPTPSPSGTPTPSPSGTPTPSPSGTPTPSPSGTPTPSPSGTPTPSPSGIPTPGSTPSAVPSTAVPAGMAPSAGLPADSELLPANTLTVVRILARDRRNRGEVLPGTGQSGMPGDGWAPGGGRHRERIVIVHALSLALGPGWCADGNLGSRFSVSAATPSRTSGPRKQSIS